MEMGWVGSCLLHRACLFVSLPLAAAVACVASAVRSLVHAFRLLFLACCCLTVNATVRIESRPTIVLVMAFLPRQRSNLLLAS